MFSNLDELKIKFIGIDEETRAQLVNAMNELIDAHGSCMWCSDTFIDIFTSFALVCSRYGCVLEYKRDDDVLNVMVILDETI